MKTVCILLMMGLTCGGLGAQAAPPPGDSFFQPAQELNKVLPRWLAFDGSYRSRVEDQDSIRFTASSDTYLLGQFFLGVKLKPAPWLSFYAQTLDAEIYFNNVVSSAPPYENSWDLHQAWVQMGDIEKYPLAFRVGRQELAYGDQRLIGPSLWQNVPRVFDAAKGSIDFYGIRLDAFAASVVISANGQTDHHEQGNLLYGLYGTIAHAVPKAGIEPYLFWRLAPVGYAAPYANGDTGHLDEKTLGFRWVGKLPLHFDYGSEMAYQAGSLGSRSISAWAGQWVAGYTLQRKAKARFYIESKYASGNSNPAGNTVGTFDQLYPTSHNKLGLVDQVGWRNIRDVRAGIELKPARKVTVSLVYNNFWLANSHDGLYAANGTVTAKSLTGAAGTHVGQELDVYGSYTWNKAVQLGFGYGHFFTGEFLNKTTPGKDYNFPYLMATYAF